MGVSNGWGKKRLIARHFGISGGHLSDILNGNRLIGRRTCKKIAEKMGVPVSEHARFMGMTPEELERALSEHIYARGEKDVASA